MKINGNPDGGGGQSAVIESLSVTSNGTYTAGAGVDGYSPVEVSVPERIPVTESLSVSINGTYTPGQGVDGYSQVVVDVPQSVTGFTEKEITEGVQVVNLYNSASSVHPYVFEKDNYLQTVNLPNCTIVGENAFASCNNLQTVSLQNCEIIDMCAFMACSNLTTVNLPVCKEFRNSAFTECSKLSELNIPNCEQIHYNVFRNTMISRVDLPKCSLVSGQGFYWCKSLKYVSLPRLMSLGNFAFEYCDYLSELTIQTEGYGCVSYGNALQNTYFARNNSGSIYTHINNLSYFMSASGWSSFSSLFVGVGDPETYMLSYNSTTGYLYGETFYLKNDFNTFLNINKTDVVSVYLPKCEYFEVGPAYTYSSPFRDLSNVTNIELPSLTVVNSVMFANLNKLETINIPLCKTILQTGFNRCSSLMSIDLPNCTFIDSRAFSECSNLSQVNIPVCERLEEGAFVGCNFTSVNLPKVSYISMAFRFCSSLEQITLGYSSVCYLQGGSGAFYNTRLNSYNVGSIFVPASLVDAYKADSNWMWYSNKIFPIPEP